MTAMSHAGYVAAGWISVLGGMALYAAASIRRGKRLSRQVPSEERRWS